MSLINCWIVLGVPPEAGTHNELFMGAQVREELTRRGHHIRQASPSTCACAARHQRDDAIAA